MPADRRSLFLWDRYVDDLAGCLPAVCGALEIKGVRLRRCTRERWPGTRSGPVTKRPNGSAATTSRHARAPVQRRVPVSSEDTTKSVRSNSAESTSVGQAARYVQMYLKQCDFPEAGREYAEREALRAADYLSQLYDALLVNTTAGAH